MQIPQFSFLSLLSAIASVSLSFGSVIPIHCETSSDSPDQVSFQAHDYGSIANGIYHITSFVTHGDISHDEGYGPRVFLDAWTGDDSQRWVFASVSQEEYIISNIGTGLNLTEIGTGRPVEAKKTLGDDPSVRWKISPFAAPSDPMFVISSATSREVLTAYGGGVVTQPIKGSTILWQLQYLGKTV